MNKEEIDKWLNDNEGMSYTELDKLLESVENRKDKLQDKVNNLQQENKQLKELYRKTCEHLFNIGNDELARYFQAQINECPTFTSQVLGDKENEKN